jgi:hypothetical protein
MVGKDPPGRLVTDVAGELVAADEPKAAHWTLNALAEAAREAGMQIARSQVRRIFVAEGVRWRQPRSWATSTDPAFGPKGSRSSRRTRPGDPAHLAACARVDLGRASGESAAGRPPRAGEGVGVRGAAGARWARHHLHRYVAQHRWTPATPGTHRGGEPSR